MPNFPLKNLGVGFRFFLGNACFVMLMRVAYKFMLFVRADGFFFFFLNPIYFVMVVKEASVVNMISLFTVISLTKIPFVDYMDQFANLLYLSGVLSLEGSE